MENFPKHVCVAETMTGGNPDILSDPGVIVQKKTTVAAALFGPPVSQKKKTKGTAGRRSTGSMGKSYLWNVRMNMIELASDQIQVY